jgi:DNA-binding response OmpR family regulator
MKVLVIEDDEKIIRTIEFAFQVEWPGVKIVSAEWGQEGIDLTESESPDVVILDLGLPDMDGLDVIKCVRRFSKVPILILTVNTDESSVVLALKLGANDYVTKPFRQLELIARVQRLLTSRKDLENGTPIVWGSFLYDYDRRVLSHGGQNIKLSCIENEILATLITNSPDVVSYSALAKAVWGDDYDGATNCLKVHIMHLRKKLDDPPGQPHIIFTRAGVGYSVIKPQ